MNEKSALRPAHPIHPINPINPVNNTSSRAIALLDARYLRWIARLDEPGGKGHGHLLREHLNSVMLQVLTRHVGPVSLLRLYWYAQTDDGLAVDDQTVRLLPSLDVDGSALVRHLANDLKALLASGRVDVVLVGSDDDRLLPMIEAAKLAGVTVGLLADERALAMPALMQQDPDWARLLREADRRVVVHSSDLAQALDGHLAAHQRQHSNDGHSTGGDSNDEPSTGLSEKFDVAVVALVQAWWAEQTDDDRDGLREELPAQRGLPPEVDRDLLLRGKNAMGRALSFHEKRVLRSQARSTALGLLALSET